MNCQLMITSQPHQSAEVLRRTRSSDDEPIVVKALYYSSIATLPSVEVKPYAAAIPVDIPVQVFIPECIPVGIPVLNFTSFDVEIFKCVPSAGLIPHHLHSHPDHPESCSLRFRCWDFLVQPRLRKMDWSVFNRVSCNATVVFSRIHAGPNTSDGMGTLNFPGGITF